MSQCYVCLTADGHKESPVRKCYRCGSACCSKGCSRMMFKTYGTFRRVRICNDCREDHPGDFVVNALAVKRLVAMAAR